MPEGRGRKEHVRRRAHFLCEYCRSPEKFDASTFSVEHIIPSSLGGGNEPENLALSCQGCNGHKYTKTQAPDPETGDAAPLFHPRRQLWEDHFAWSAGYTLILGTTPTGRATVEALRLNRENLIQLRLLLRAAGKHPPTVASTAD